jgi:hypothetical protein
MVLIVELFLLRIDDVFERRNLAHGGSQVEIFASSLLKHFSHHAAAQDMRHLISM